MRWAPESALRSAEFLRCARSMAGGATCRKAICGPISDWESRMRLFFFQAEDGIRVTSVTGVQACALPISSRAPEWWLSRLGIGFVVIAVLFLYSYAIDKGWITPPVRVLAGALVGSALFWAATQIGRAAGRGRGGVWGRGGRLRGRMEQGVG